MVLRDENGRYRGIAKNAEEQKQLKRLHKQHNAFQPLENLLKREDLKEHVRQMKARIRERGCRERITICGVRRNSETGKSEYRHYEFFKRERWRRAEVLALRTLIKTHVPNSRAGVFIFEPELKNGTLFYDEQDWLSQGKMRACQSWREFCRVHRVSSQI